MPCTALTWRRWRSPRPGAEQHRLDRPEPLAQPTQRRCERLRVDGVGVLRFNFETFALAGPGGHVLYVYFPEPGGKDDEALRGLA
ncbi:hypothetical protein [Amycolatopsis sp. NPDC059021]|uniref:MmyB family transcriptional regulator n=1 Tax=Amycolatopsis sp. NPDC059021 TaxID=3346704 RepID=UPI0036716915